MDIEMDLKCSWVNSLKQLKYTLALPVCKIKYFTLPCALLASQLHVSYFILHIALTAML